MCALITVVLLQARQECHVANLPHTAPLEHLPSRGGDEKDATASCTIVLNALERSELLILGRLFLLSRYCITLRGIYLQTDTFEVSLLHPCQ